LIYFNDYYLVAANVQGFTLAGRL